MEETAFDEEQPPEPEPVPAEVAGDDDFWGSFNPSKKDKKKKKKKNNGVFIGEDPMMAVDLSEAPPPEPEPEPVIEAALPDDGWGIPTELKKKKKKGPIVSWDE